MGQVLLIGAGKLAAEIDGQNLPIIEPLETDSFVARSVLQKAIRRGLFDIAISAAVTLLEADGSVLWRRLLVTALEDIGIGSPHVLFQLAAASTMTQRRQIADDRTIAIAIVRQMCCAEKCQAANDLFNLAHNGSPFDRGRFDAGDNDLTELENLYDAAKHLLSNLPISAPIGQQTDFIRSFFSGLAPVQLDAYVWAYQRSRVPLALTTLALHQPYYEQSEAMGADTSPPPTFEWISGIPSFALDQYTRAGKAAIRQYVARSSKWQFFARKAKIARADQVAAAGELLFRVEGAAIDRRRNWRIGYALYHRSLMIGCFMDEQFVHEGLDLIMGELDLINCLRRQNYRNAGVTGQCN